MQYKQTFKEALVDAVCPLVFEKELQAYCSLPILPGRGWLIHLFDLLKLCVSNINFSATNNSPRKF